MAAELFFDGLIDFFDAVFFGDFPVGGSGLFGEAHEDAAAVAAAERRVREQDGVNQGVGTLGGFDGVEQTGRAAVLAAVGQHDHRLAVFLILQDIV